MIDSAAHPFLAVLLARLFPTRSIIVITDGLKTQELYHQDIQTWLKNANVPSAAGTSERTLRFFPAWETLPHEPKLPHVDVISDRLDTLSSLASERDAPCGADLQTAGSKSLQFRGCQPTLEQPLRGAEPVIIVTTLIALLQKTFPPGELRARSRILNCGDSADPLSLIEWLEEQGYEPEAQVSQRGEIAFGDGIGDLIRFFDRVRGDGDERLLLVPRTTGRRVAQGGHNVQQAAEFGRKIAEAGFTANTDALQRLRDVLVSSLRELAQPEPRNQELSPRRAYLAALQDLDAGAAPASIALNLDEIVNAVNTASQLIDAEIAEKGGATA